MNKSNENNDINQMDRAHTDPFFRKKNKKTIKQAEKLITNKKKTISTKKRKRKRKRKRESRQKTPTIK